MVSFGKFHDFISCYPLPLIASLGSRLAEIGIRTTFVVMVSIAALVLDELSGQIERMAAKSTDPEQMSKNIDEWKSNYDLAFELCEHINGCFSPVVFLLFSFDNILAIIECQNILIQSTNPRYYFHFLHIILRCLLILIVSQSIESKVNRAKIFVNIVLSNIMIERLCDGYFRLVGWLIILETFPIHCLNQNYIFRSVIKTILPF